MIRRDAAEHSVFNHEPRTFQVGPGEEAKIFVSENLHGSDFQLAEVVAEKTGVAELQRRSIDDKVEAETLERLKSVQESAYREAFDLGLMEGTEKAYQESKEEILAALQRFDLLVDSIENLRIEISGRYEAEIVKLVTSIANRIVCAEVETRPELIVQVLKTAVSEIESEDRMILRVSMKDKIFLESVRERLTKDSARFAKMKVVVDESVVSGGCVLDTNLGVIDATLSERVERIMAAVMNKLPRPISAGESLIENSISSQAEIEDVSESDDQSDPEDPS